jgi:hypothetical protein
MSENIKAIKEEDLEDIYETDIGLDDYGFVFDSDGEIKAIFLPENLPFKPPKNITKILKLLGITDIDAINGVETLH